MIKNEKLKNGDTLIGVIHMNKSGSAYFTNDDIDKDIYIPSKYSLTSLHLDTVKIVMTKSKGKKKEGHVISVEERFKTKYTGVIELSKTFAFVKIDSNKIGVDFFIPIERTLDATNGDKVVVELTSWKKGKRNPNGKIIEILGKSGDNDAEIHSILHEYDLPYKFSSEVEDEANAIDTNISKEEISKRLDLRDVLTYTIDPDTAKDFDDALSFEKIDKGYKIGIHIADVSHYVKPGTELDKEAFNRGTSVYLVDRVVPMLPENLSNGLCSLRPNEEKLAFSVIVTIDDDAKISNTWFGRTVIKSNKRLTYEEAQKIIDTKNSRSKLNKSILTLDKLAKIMRKARNNEGTLNFNSREIKFKLDEDKKPIGLTFKIQSDSNRLIEEYMLLANRLVAELINSKKIPSVNRIHENPDEIKLNNIKNYVAQFGITLNLSDEFEIRNSLNELSEFFRGKPQENMINNLVIRTMKKAAYSTKDIGHYGLSFSDYVHFTSPIRRYPDVMIHRILNRILSDYKPYKEDRIDSQCKYLSNREIVAQKASRDSIKFKQCEFMMDKVGKLYNGVVSSVTNFGLFVDIVETNCDGFVSISEISGDFYTVDLDNYRVIGNNTGTQITLGDKVMVIVKSVDMDKKNINLELIKL